MVAILKINKNWALLIVLTFVLSAMPIYAGNLVQGAEKDFQDVKPIINNGIVIFLDNPALLFDGKISVGESKPFIHNGVMLASVDIIAKYLDADFGIDEKTKIITIESNGFRTQFMFDFNIIIFNDEALAMRTKPIERDGHIYLPVDVIAKALNVTCFRDYDQGIAVIRGAKPLDSMEYKTLANQLGIELRKPGINKELDVLGKKFAVKDIYQYSRENKLFVSDRSGRLVKWVLLDDFTLAKEELNIAQIYPANKVFLAVDTENGMSLFEAGSDVAYSPAPEMITRNDLRYAMYEFVSLKKDSSDPSGMELFKNALSGDLYNKDFIEKKTEAINNGTYDEIVFSSSDLEIKSEFARQWADICMKAKSGDILLFRNKESHDKYGYFNHAALIVDVDRTSNTIHLLEARSPELGVGAELPMDYVNADSFTNESYWNKCDIVVLCSVEGISERTGMLIAEKAIKHFEDYEFGYGSFYGAKQTTCVQLINDAFKLGGIRIISNNEYRLMLKSALDGDVSKLILLPDDIVLSDTVKINGYLER